ncbi:MAG TPA: SusC/RagA family TonB-linked outer membrane protein, partial [Anseongella sp.]|nr:SusC/RagA family TonB-linked outer membrane protein [Anseongella sp.]
MNRLITNWLLMLCCLGAAIPVLGQEAAVMVSGTVTEAATGEALPGVSVIYKGSAEGTGTDLSGNYSLRIPPGEGVLVFSHMGFLTAELPVNTASMEGAIELNAALEPDIAALNEVVVIGYGTRERQDLTGAISSVSAEEISKQPLVSVDQLLQGKAAGMQISNSSGAPGGRVNIRIRGASSINAGNEPLFVIDGIPVYNSSKDPEGTSYGTFTPTNALASLNPNDIASVEVLKDASATAIYGSRGSNGVVLITTKRGTGDKVNVDYNGYYGMQQLSGKIDLMNGEEHAAYLNDWAEGRDLPAPFADPAAIGEGTDWQDEVFRTAAIQNHQVSVSSGKGNTRYYISGNYFNQEGIALNSGLERYAIRVNVDNKINQKLTLSQSLTFNRTVNNSVPTSSAGSDNIR